MLPIIPIAIVAGVIALVVHAFEDEAEDDQNKIDSTGDNPSDLVEIIEASVELLPYKHGESIPPQSDAEKPNILSKIAEAINMTDAAGIKDLDKVMVELGESGASSREVKIALLAHEYLEWLEKQPKHEEIPALTYNDTVKQDASSTVPLLSIDDVLASIEKWNEEQNYISLPSSMVRGCACTKRDGKSKTLFPTEAAAKRVADFWCKKWQSARTLSVQRRQWFSFKNRPFLAPFPLNNSFLFTMAFLAVRIAVFNPYSIGERT